MPNDNFFSHLQEKFHDAAASPCLSLPDGRSLTYAEVDKASAKMAGALLNCGASAGDRILVQVEKSPENVAVYLGALRAGLVYIPLNTAYTVEEVGYFLKDAEPSVFVCAPDKSQACTDILESTDVQTVLTLDNKGSGSLAKAAGDASPFNDAEPRSGDDLAAILYTSGTTGRSKGAMLTHENLASNAIALHALWGLRDGDVLLHALPIFHIHGLFVALHTALLNGSEILFLPKFDVASVREALPRATMMMGVPTFYSRLLAEQTFGTVECAHMRLFISGSAPLTEETFSAFEHRTGHRILERYGMSEAGMIASNPLSGERIAGTVGFALPGVDVRVTADGQPAAAGEPGGVQVRGPNVFSGYWRNSEKTQEAFDDDGWFVTGDIGSLDQEGRLTLSGRAKDLIIAGGLNIYPKEIEQVLDAIPGVLESAVIGVPHPDLGEGVAAVLASDNTPLSDDIINVAIAPLAEFKHPRKFFWLDSLPRNAMGKVQKQVLRKQFWDAFSK